MVDGAFKGPCRHIELSCIQRRREDPNVEKLPMSKPSCRAGALHSTARISCTNLVKSLLVPQTLQHGKCW